MRDEIKTNRNRTLRVRHARGRQAASRHIKCRSPEMVDRRTQRQPNLSHNLRPHVQRGVSIFPFRQRKRRPPRFFHWRLRTERYTVRPAANTKSSEGFSYNSRYAWATGRVAARTAGNSPPTNPITSAKIIPFTSNSGVILTAKARYEKV